MSTSTSKPIGSLIATARQGLASPTQSAPGAPGLDAARSSRSATLPPLPAGAPAPFGEARIERLLQGCDQDCELLRRWWAMDWQTRRQIGEDEAMRIGRIARSAERALDHAMQPAPLEAVAEMLLGFVEMLGVLEPGERGIRLYEVALGPLPLCLYPVAAMRVARTHKWRSLPTPAAFFASVAGELAFIQVQRAQLRVAIDTTATLLNQRDMHRRMNP